MWLVVRTHGAAGASAAAISAQVRSIDPGVPISDLEELFQEVFLAVWLNASLRLSASFQVLAVRYCPEQMPHGHAPGHVPRPKGGRTANAILRFGHSPVELAIATETAHLVAAGVALLPPQQPAVMVLRICGTPRGENADILETTEGAVRANMHHGLHRCENTCSPK